MAHCKRFHYSETRSTLSNHWLVHCCSLKQRGCFHNSKVWCLYVCIGVLVFTYTCKHKLNPSRLISCAAAFIFRKAVTLLFVPNRISLLSLSEPLSFSAPDSPQSVWRIWWEQGPGCPPEHTAANQSLPCWAPAARHLCGNWAGLALWQYDDITPSLHCKRWKEREVERGSERM